MEGKDTFKSKSKYNDQDGYDFSSEESFQFPLSKKYKNKEEVLSPSNKQSHNTIKVTKSDPNVVKSKDIKPNSQSSSSFNDDIGFTMNNPGYNLNLQQEFERINLYQNSQFNPVYNQFVPTYFSQFPYCNINNPPFYPQHYHYGSFSYQTPNINYIPSFNSMNNSQVRFASHPQLIRPKFKSSSSELNYDELSLDQIRIRTPYFCKEQQGCKFLQKKLETNPNYAEENILPLIYPYLKEIINDQFGNYLIQKILELCPTVNIVKLYDYIYTYFLQIGTNQFGTRVMQKVMEKSLEEGSSKRFLISLEHHISKFVKDEFGYHIVNKSISLYDKSEIKFIYKYIKGNLLDVCCNKYGCLVVQALLNKSLPDIKDKLISKIIKISNRIISKKYGCYVVTYVIKLNEESAKEMLDRVKEELNSLVKLNLSKLPFEAFLQYGNEVSLMFVKEMIERCDLSLILQDKSSLISKFIQ